MKVLGFVAAAFIGLIGGNAGGQTVLNAHAMPWNVGFIPSAAIFFDLRALRDPVIIEGLVTAMNSGAGEAFTFELLTREGTSLGGSATSGPGSNLFGWTSLGIVHGTCGSMENGLSLPVQVPRFVIQPGHVVGVALRFDFDSAPFCFGDAAYATYQDSSLSLATGDARSPCFTAGQMYFPRRQLVGSILYDLAPCYPNCDLSTVAPVLNVNDFVCFLGKFANGDSYANCDGSTAPPVLNVNDFVCFTTAFAQGCQ